MILPKQIQTQDQTLNRIQSSMREALQKLQSDEVILNENIVTVTIGTTDTLVEHGLGRVPIGYIVIDRDADSQVWTSSSENNLRSRRLILVASAEVTAKLYIF